MIKVFVLVASIVIVYGTPVPAAVIEHCQPVKAYTPIIENFNSITEGFNQQKWDLIDPYADNDVSLTRIEEKMKKTHKKTKPEYKSHLENDAWKRNPKWSNVICEHPVDVTADLVKLIVTYDFTFDKPPSGSRTTVPAFAVMYFKKDGMLVDFTVGSLPK